MTIRHTLSIPKSSADFSERLARLSGSEGFSRSLLVGVLPLIAFEAFGDKETIASIYFASSIITLLFTLNIASLERWLKRRWLMTLGLGLLLGSILLFFTASAPLFAVGIGLRAAGSTIFSVCLSLYIMQFIGKREWTRSESTRMLYQGIAWLIAPTLGIWLYDNISPTIVYLVAIGVTVGVIIYFWRLGLSDPSETKLTESQPSKPWDAIGRFARQRNLRIAYVITLSRACFWVALFVYGPIYVIEAGLPIWISGALLSFVSGLLLFSPLVRRLTEQFGTRQLIIALLILIGLSSIGLGLVGEAKPIGLLFWILGSVGAAGVDVLANIPFMRVVRPRQRSEMTMVFTTWREGSSLLTQAIVYLTLLIAPFWVFFFVLAAIQFIAAISTSYLPRRL